MFEGTIISGVADDRFIRSTCSALSRSVLLGIVPLYTQLPPTPGSRSITATCLPALAPWMAAFWPAGPLPITTMS